MAIRRSFALLLGLTACGSPAEPTTPAAAEPVGVVAESKPNCDCPASTASPQECPAPEATPPVSAAPAPSLPAADGPYTPPSEMAVDALEAKATGPVQEGIRLGNHNCEFHESVDTYRRQCSVTKNGDGSLQVTAKGTELNPNNGFAFSLHGGPYEFAAKGTLNAFDICTGPFVARAIPIIDKGVRTFELRFKGHCSIVVR